MSTNRMITVRLSPELHRAAVHEARKCEISLNQYCVACISTGLNRDILRDFREDPLMNLRTSIASGADYRRILSDVAVLLEWLQAEVRGES